MCVIVGQNRIKSVFDNYTLETMPRTLLILGEQGSGKTLLINELSKQLKLDIVTLSNQTTAEDLIDFAQQPLPKLYHINLSGISEKAQNKFLKFIEEPSPSVYIAMEAESEVGLLTTILNRCTKLVLEPYTIEELQSFTWSPKNVDPLIYKFYNTPGKLNNLTSLTSFDALCKLCNAILDFFPKQASYEYAKAMSIVTKINTKTEEPNKFNFYIFIDVFSYTAFNHYLETSQPFSFEAYRYTIQQKQKLLNKSVAKEAFLLTFLNHLWEMAHDVT